MAVIKASLEVTRPSLPQSAAMVSSAFKIFSVAASSVLKVYRIFSRDQSSKDDTEANQKLDKANKNSETKIINTENIKDQMYPINKTFLNSHSHYITLQF